MNYGINDDDLLVAYDSCDQGSETSESDDEQVYCDGVFEKREVQRGLLPKVVAEVAPTAVAPLPEQRRGIVDPVAGIHVLLDGAGCPANIGQWHQMLFSLEAPIRMTVQQYQVIWPFCDNYHTSVNTGHFGTYRQYRCRFSRPQQVTKGGGVHFTYFSSVS